jgi:hypothetical protein
MNKSVKVVLNEKGIQTMLKSEEMKSILGQLGAQKAAQAGPGYNYRVYDFPERSACNVYPDTKEAAHDNYENNTLVKVIG